MAQTIAVVEQTKRAEIVDQENGTWLVTVIRNSDSQNLSTQTLNTLDDAYQYAINAVK